MTTLNSFYAQAAAVANLDQRRWALGAAYRIGEYVRFGYSVSAARALVLAAPQYANGLVAAGLDDDYALIDDTGGGSSGPVVFLSDPFADTNGVTLQAHTGENGVTWTKHPNSAATDAVIQGNRLKNADAGGTTLYFASVVPSSADYTVSSPFVLLTDNNSSAVGPAGRLDTVANTWVVGRYNTTSDAWEILQSVAGTATTLGTPFAGALVSGDTCDLVFVGDNVSLKVNGVERIAPVATTVTAAGRIGVRLGGTSGAAVGVHLESIQAAA